MASGMARGARRRGKRIAFGAAGRIIWDKNSEPVFRHNPNVAPPGSEGAADLEWIPYYKGHRIYNRQDKAKGRWIWNYDFRAAPGEIFLTEVEVAAGKRHGRGFVLIEPNTERWKSVAPNKDWGLAKYQAVADQLRDDGYRVAQFRHDPEQPALKGIENFRTFSFRDALALLSHARVYIGPEGGLHHGAAAVDVPAVVLFGGFIPPTVTGYAVHANLTGGASACGSLTACDHCKAAMAAISVEEVVAAAKDYM